jgi:excisionase family DNA binding protein
MSFNSPSLESRAGHAPLLDIAGAADYLGTTERHMRRLVAERRIPYTKLGSGRSARLRFDVDRLTRWVDEHSFEPESGDRG